MSKYILSHFQASQILVAHKEGRGAVSASLDLGMSQIHLELSAEGVVLPDGQHLSWGQIEKIAEDENSCFRVVENELQKVQAFSEVTNRPVSLYPTSGPPSMLIAGFPMHRIKNTDPGKDTGNKIKALGSVRGRVLDTNTGLGYTAIALSEHAAHVTTVELDPDVLEIARDNPWSQALFDNPRITQLIGDSFDVVEELEDGSFDAILHDPPTIQLAGHLYSGDFYAELYRVLRSGGRLFHYVGDPDSRQGARLTKGVTQRLGEAGFRDVRPYKAAFGVVAKK